jgi:hypothetical protein
MGNIASIEKLIEEAILSETVAVSLGSYGKPLCLTVGDNVDPPDLAAALNLPAPIGPPKCE